LGWKALLGAAPAIALRRRSQFFAKVEASWQVHTSSIAGLAKSRHFGPMPVAAFFGGDARRMGGPCEGHENEPMGSTYAEPGFPWLWPITYQRWAMKEGKRTSGRATGRKSFFGQPPGDAESPLGFGEPQD